jgi:hypothetical protein
MAQKPKKLLDRVREIIRLKQYSNKTGKACFFNRLSASATGAKAVVLESVGQFAISTGQWGYKIGLVFLVLGSLMYAILFVTSGAVPLALGWFGVIASILAAGGVWLSLINPKLSMVSFLALIPYELVIGLNL